MVAAIDPQYIDEVRDKTINTITKSIPEIQKYLFDNFADVDSTEVAKEEEKLRNHYWNISDPPMAFFDAIDGLQLLATAVNIPKTQQQLITLCLDIVQKTGDMERGLAEWFELKISRLGPIFNSISVRPIANSRKFVVKLYRTCLSIRLILLPKIYKIILSILENVVISVVGLDIGFKIWTSLPSCNILPL